MKTKTDTRYHRLHPKHICLFGPGKRCTFCSKPINIVATIYHDYLFFKPCTCVQAQKTLKQVETKKMKKNILKVKIFI